MPESKRFLLRLSPDLFEALRRWADDDMRSINAQMEFLLTEQARQAGRLRGKPRPRPAPPDAPSGPPDEQSDDEQPRQRAGVSG
ncbi:MAG TPA: hypothetical protein VG405_06800 [Solirubrobacteraceae bacterium]|jgi:hypothetical protein|nr:hypothetical protein [Solirubrobacteraceae bacterium]